MTDRLLRAADIVLATVALVVLSPVLVAAAVAARATQGTPIFYRASRVGIDGESFAMLKFRTMQVDADRGASSTPSTDPRITPLGRRLRRYKVDELPQLFNVVRGEMSLVGPRPQIPWVVEAYDDFERRLLAIRPGMTDLASIWFSDEGERLAGSDNPDAAYQDLIAPGKAALGVWYVEHRSLPLYARILFLTIQAVAGRDVRPRIEQLTGIDADALARGGRA